MSTSPGALAALGAGRGLRQTLPHGPQAEPAPLALDFGLPASGTERTTALSPWSVRFVMEAPGHSVPESHPLGAPAGKPTLAGGQAQRGLPSGACVSRPLNRVCTSPAAPRKHVPALSPSALRPSTAEWRRRVGSDPILRARGHFPVGCPLTCLILLHSLNGGLWGSQL